MVFCAIENVSTVNGKLNQNDKEKRVYVLALSLQCIVLISFDFFCVTTITLNIVVFFTTVTNRLLSTPTGATQLTFPPLTLHQHRRKEKLFLTIENQDYSLFYKKIYNQFRDTVFFSQLLMLCTMIDT